MGWVNLGRHYDCGGIIRLSGDEIYCIKCDDHLAVVDPTPAFVAIGCKDSLAAPADNETKQPTEGAVGRPCLESSPGLLEKGIDGKVWGWDVSTDTYVCRWCGKEK